MKCLKSVALAICLAALIALAGCGGNMLEGTYAAAANHTFDFKNNGEVVMQDNGVSWSGSYEYNSTDGVYEIVINEAFGSVEQYTAVLDGDVLIVTYPNGNQGEYEKQ